MKFVHPSDTMCSACGIKSQQAVDDLIRLKAKCPNCGFNLSETGLRMRAMMDEWSDVVAVIEILLILEDDNGKVVFDDDLIEQCKTIADIAKLASNLWQRDKPLDFWIDHVIVAIEVSKKSNHLFRITSPEARATQADADKRISDLLYPHRWKDGSNS
ncbi:MAG: hypothetical protein H7X92_09305 [Chitinophagales bacterium]|nr:hypothetical protein [Hyphomicrobiales bacterium]